MGVNLDSIWQIIFNDPCFVAMWAVAAIAVVTYLSSEFVWLTMTSCS